MTTLPSFGHLKRADCWVEKKYHWTEGLNSVIIRLLSFGSQLPYLYTGNSSFQLKVLWS